jgi:SAM-dependent methyltransferase
MREEWNERARSDAHYFVAFGRRDQDAEEFLASAADVVRDLEGELKRFPSDVALKARRALEIGCGPGRLMRPMSRYFGEIHGIDVSDEMITRSKHQLRDIAHAHTHHASGSDLSQFPSNHFDFVYSYAVFQHIPSAEIVYSYLRETIRVLKPGGFARFQINDLPRPARTYTTWEGVRISSDEVRAFTRENGVDLLSLTGIETQYMWTTWRKPRPCRIRQLVNAFSGERAVLATGRLACATLLIDDLPDACDLHSLAVFFDGVPGTCCYVGPFNGISQLNVYLPAGTRTGIVPVRLEWNGRRLCEDSMFRVLPPGPVVPHLVAVSDGINLLSYQHITSGSIKVTLDDVISVDGFEATVDGAPVADVGFFRTDPLSNRYEVDFHLPPGMGAGGHVLEVRMGKRMLTRMGIEVVR